VELPIINSTLTDPFCLEGSPSFLRLQLEKGFTNTQVTAAFRTGGAGLIVYAGPEAGGTDFLALLVSSGRVLFLFDTGDGVRLVQSQQQTYADNQWHMVVVDRVTVAGIATEVTLRVDSEVSQQSFSIGSSGGSLEVSELLYVGGTDQALPLPLRAFESNFEGCLDYVTFDGVDISQSSPLLLRAFGVAQCTQARFDTERSYIRYHGAVAQQTEESAISLQFRTTDANGVLLYIGTANATADFVSLVLRGGQVVLQQNFGAGVTSLQTAEMASFADGEWHRIDVARAGTLTLVIVDSKQYPPITNNERLLNTDGNVYVGGVAEAAQAPNFQTLHADGFTGCIKGVNVDGTALVPTMPSAGLSLGVQPCAACE